MMDAAAAAMSDPAMNRWFRRRWVTPEMAEAILVIEQPKLEDQLDLTGRQLLEAWRQARSASDRGGMWADTVMS